MLLKITTKNGNNRLLELTSRLINVPILEKKQGSLDIINLNKTMF